MNYGMDVIKEKINTPCSHSKIIVEVQDNGIGMDLERQQVLFQMFGTINESS